MSTESGNLARQLAEARSQIEVARAAIGAELRRLDAHVIVGHTLAPELETELMALVSLGLWRSESFAILAKSHPPSAEQSLLKSVFHPGIHPDQRPGMYVSDLELMLDDLVEHAGRSGLEDFFATLPLSDNRLFSDGVVEALQDVLHLDFDAAETWLRDVRIRARLIPVTPTQSGSDRSDSQKAAVEAIQPETAVEEQTDSRAAEALARMRRSILAARDAIGIALQPRYHAKHDDCPVLTPDEARELTALIRLGERRTLAFSVLAKSDIAHAKRVLREVMFDPDSDPARWPDGFNEAMRQLLTTLVRYEGEEGFERFMRTVTLPDERWEDPRIINGVGKALGLMFDDAENWLHRVRGVDVHAVVH
jgi:hypothetical protein